MSFLQHTLKCLSNCTSVNNDRDPIRRINRTAFPSRLQKELWPHHQQKLRLRELRILRRNAFLAPAIPDFGKCTRPMAGAARQDVMDLADGEAAQGVNCVRVDRDQCFGVRCDVIGMYARTIDPATFMRVAAVYLCLCDGVGHSTDR
jgi:hypothetical protein